MTVSADTVIAADGGIACAHGPVDADQVLEVVLQRRLTTVPLSGAIVIHAPA